MAKPIAIIRADFERLSFPDGERFGWDNFERYVVKLQEQMSDYHVLGLPSSKILDELVELEVLNAPDLNETNFFELKELVLNEFRNGTIKQR